MNRFFRAQRVHTPGGSVAASPKKILKLDQLQDILKPYERVLKHILGVNIRYFNPLAYDSIT